MNTNTYIEVKPNKLTQGIFSSFGGSLHRLPDGWRWSDGSTEPRVSDVTLNDRYNSPRMKGQIIEVPVFKAGLEWALAWTTEGNYVVSESMYSDYLMEFLKRFPQNRKEPIQSYLVPMAHWNKRGATIVGLRFNSKDALVLAEKSRILGHDWPLPATPAAASAPESMDLPSFELDELKLMAEAMIGINVYLTTRKAEWDLLTKGNGLRHYISDAICRRRLDLQFDVDALSLLGKLEALSFTRRAMLTLDLAEFWNRCLEQNAESIIDRLLKDFKSAMDATE